MRLLQTAVLCRLVSKSRVMNTRNLHPAGTHQNEREEEESAGRQESGTMGGILSSS
jgi:hypothetical protein